MTTCQIVSEKANLVSILGLPLNAASAGGWCTFISLPISLQPFVRYCRRSYANACVSIIRKK